MLPGPAQDRLEERPLLVGQATRERHDLGDRRGQRGRSAAAWQTRVTPCRGDERVGLSTAGGVAVEDGISRIWMYSIAKRTG